MPDSVSATTQQRQRIMATTDSVSTEHVFTTLKGLGRVIDRNTWIQHLQEAPFIGQNQGSDRVPLDPFLAFELNLCEQFQDPLLLARAFSKLDYTPAFLRGTFLGNGLNIEDAISLLIRYQPVGSDFCRARLQQTPQGARMSLLPAPNAPRPPEVLDAVLYGLARTLMAFGVTQFERICLEGSPDNPSILDQYQSLFPGPLEFASGQPAIHFSADFLSRPLPWSTCSAIKLGKRERRLRKLQNTPWTDSVSILVPSLLRGEAPGIDQCADLLAVSRRTLQRNIGAEGMTFSDIVEQSRQRLAQNWLSRGYSNEDTALLLGYRQPAQFYRTFRSWFNVSPNEFRQRIRN